MRTHEFTTDLLIGKKDQNEGDYDDEVLFESGSGGSLEASIPGLPGEDYPIFAEVPDTAFSCDGQVEGGYYADPETECQAFHICGSDGDGGLNKYSFLCPNGTLMNQQYFICDWWFNVDCSLAETLYSLNDEVAAERESYAEYDTGNDRVLAKGSQENGTQGRRTGQGQTKTNDRGGGGAQGQSDYRGAGSSDGEDSPPGRTRNRASSRGSPGQRGGSRRGGGGGQRSKQGYLAPGSGGDYEDNLSADVGYGAPGGQGGQGAGDFPLLTEYSRNARETQLGEKSQEQTDIVKEVEE